jgi:hypothetical protein
MNQDEIRQLSYLAKISDNRTGEEFQFVSFPIESAYVICNNKEGNCIYLTPDRIGRDN